ncbi:MFS transporter, partial [Candidatus Bathyarchaeota archaeon]|nr:MFS transporter [Candidatus Bathyarchaeota archaeon]
ITFSFINYLTATPQNADIEFNTGLIFSFFMAIFALLGGFFLDSFGRKRVTIIGFVMLGFSSAIQGLSSNTIILYFSAIIDGIAWGFILVIFIWVLWSDLSHNSASDKYYALGVSPYFASMFLNIVIGQYIRDNFVDTSVFSFTAFFLFLAVLPLVYAPETLPEKNLKERELKNYLNNAQKIKEKYA